ncbi:hypothetical protein EDI_180230 [Entamoeba dispar SAW760]|uniref:UDENN domain-containing protein n=1 Tax=Entamoeba dispar (strain ATCC PRA-260 / SAW760) TaxID=370354 RepID=B0E915_ENTDS|nr:uncharacterized protein EDI_180230 [Entamoeba dispar SAW760]EDR28988.1 hypothetical protein EDI_180230 [Entamoeba dispar SAW760]|eukprot:EDR28988.1 hypothetical protein EDI_180230 [Entamoeba dispar SAW760]
MSIKQLSKNPTNLEPKYPHQLLLQAFYLTVTSSESDPLHININCGINDESRNNIANVMYFIYPDVPKIVKKEDLLTVPPLIHSFVSTDENGKRYYYYVQRWNDDKTPKILILVSGRYSSLYIRLLPVLKELLNTKGLTHLRNLFSQLKAYEYPESDLVINESTIISHNPEIPIFPILKKLGPADFVELLGRILLEENTMFLVESIDQGMPIIQAFLQILIPFEWQGVLIPMLPIEESYAGFAGCPTPLIFGTTQQGLININKLYSNTLDINIYNVLTSKFQRRKSGLNLFAFKETGRLLNQLKSIIDNPSFEHPDNLICNCFSQLFLDLFGRYFAFFEQQNIGFVFNNKNFIKSSSTELQIFLTAFNQSQMFERFIQHRINYISVMPEFRRSIFIDCPLFKSKEKPPFLRMRDISNEPQKCCGCGQKIDMDRAVCVYGKNLTFHTECLRCKSCDCFLFEKESFDRQCMDCLEEDCDELENQFDNTCRWEQVDISINKHKSDNETLQRSSFSKVLQCLSFYETEKSDSQRQKEESEKMRKSSVFLSGPTGSIFLTRSSKIGTFSATLNPNDSRKTIIVKEENQPLTKITQPKISLSVSTSYIGSPISSVPISQSTTPTSFVDINRKNCQLPLKKDHILPKKEN